MKAKPRSAAENTAARGALGGAADEAGGAYRRAVAAWFVAHGLHGKPVHDRFGVPQQSATVQAVELETDASVDDIKVELHDGFCLFVQTTRHLSLGPYRSAMEQCLQAVKEPTFDVQRHHLVIIAGTLTGPLQRLAQALDRSRMSRSGRPSEPERAAIKQLHRMLEGQSRTVRERLPASLYVVGLSVEEESHPDARQAVDLLDGRVVQAGSGLPAWLELIRIAGVLARRRGGLVTGEWLSELRNAGYPLMADVEISRAAASERRRQAVERYLSHLRARGDSVDLRALGADFPPIEYAEMDSWIRVAPPEGRARDLLWAFRRRGKVILTGLPGSGKTTLIARTCSEWTRFPGWPLPVSISLRRLAAATRAAGFRSALVHIAIEDLSPEDAAFVRAELEEALQTGNAVLFLDGLDEVVTERRGELVSALDTFLRQIHPDTDVLLATRGIAYRHARTLGFHELQVKSPEHLERGIRAVLQIASRERNPPNNDAEAWIKIRSVQTSGTAYCVEPSAWRQRDGSVSIVANRTRPGARNAGRAITAARTRRAARE